MNTTLSTPLVGISQGGNGWGESLSTFVDPIYAITPSLISLPWYPLNNVSDLTINSTDNLIEATQSALTKGMRVRIPIHLDNDISLANIPWSNPTLYSDCVLTLTNALNIIPLNERPNITLVVGNENSPKNSSNNPESWILVEELYSGLWTQCVSTVHKISPGIIAAVPAPFNQGLGSIQAAIGGAMGSGALSSTGAKEMDLHYIFEDYTIESSDIDPNILLDNIEEYFQIPLAIGKFGGNLGNLLATQQTIAWSKATGYPVSYWEYYEPGGTQLVGNKAMIKGIVGAIKGAVINPVPIVNPIGELPLN